jgi:hypothetical protein
MRAAHRDVVSVELGVACEGLFDGMMNFPSIEYRADDIDVVLDIGDAQDVGCDEPGLLTLIMPLGGTGEGDDSIFDRSVDGDGNQCVQHQRVQHFTAELGVFPAVCGQDADVKCVIDIPDPVNTFGRPLGLTFLPKTAHRVPQCHDAIVNGHRDTSAVDLGIPPQLVGDISLECLVGHIYVLFLRTARRGFLVCPAFLTL